MILSLKKLLFFEGERMKVDIHQLLPDLIPTHSKPVWEFENFLAAEYVKSGIYVFWDQESFRDPNRFHFEYQNLPLYIGKAIKTPEKEKGYGIGRRIYDHFYNHKTDIYTEYTFFVDLYIFEDILEGTIDDPVKHRSYYYWDDPIKHRDKRNSFPLERLPLSAYFKDRCELNERALTNIYEPYMISRRIPIFNKKSNYYSGETKKQRIENVEDYIKRYGHNHWTKWTGDLNKAERNAFKKNIQNRFFK